MGKLPAQPTVAICGSRKLRDGSAPRLLVKTIVALPEDSLVLVRAGMMYGMGPFERDVTKMCGLLGLRVEPRVPRETTGSPWPEEIQEPQDTMADRHPSNPRGRQLTFRRDLEMIDDADLVLLFVDEAEMGNQNSGTVMMVGKALEADGPTKAVYAYTVLKDGTLERIGEHDPGDTWAKIVPQV